MPKFNRDVEELTGSKYKGIKMSPKDFDGEWKRRKEKLEKMLDKCDSTKKMPKRFGLLTLWYIFAIVSIYSLTSIYYITPMVQMILTVVAMLVALIYIMLWLVLDRGHIIESLFDVLDLFDWATSVEILEE
jgi:hypothetical protein